MTEQEQEIRRRWADIHDGMRGYAYRACQGMLAGHRDNPLFPPSDTLEEISAEGIAEAYRTTLDKAEQILAWPEERQQRTAIIRHVRNGCRHAVATYRRDRARYSSLASEYDQPAPPEPDDDCHELLISLPQRLRRTAELLSQGKNPTEVARIAGINKSTVYRHAERIGQVLGADFFCRWATRAADSMA